MNFFSADDEVVQAGHLEKFRSWVLVSSDGKNTWLSPATFKSTCKLNVQFFPFDKQKCSMLFRSLTADSTLLNLYTRTVESDDPEEGNGTIKYLGKGSKKDKRLKRPIFSNEVTGLEHKYRKEREKMGVEEDFKGTRAH